MLATCIFALFSLKSKVAEYKCWFKYDTNEHIYETELRNRNRLTDIENRLVVAKGDGLVRRYVQYRGSSIN